MRDDGATGGRGGELRSLALAGSAALVALGVLSGCSLFGRGDDTTPRATAPVASTSPTTSSPVAPQTPTTTESPSPSPTASPATTPVPTTTRWPRAVGEPQQGDSVWGVYLAVAHSGTDPSLVSAQKAVVPLGYSAGVADVACDDGAMTALKLDQHDYWVAASLYFKTKKDATDFANSYLGTGGTVIGTAKVSVGCLD